MKEQRQTPDIEQFKAWARVHQRQALEVCASQAYAAVELTRVAEYIKPIFDRYKFQYRGELAEKCNLSGPIPNPDELYLCDDEARVAEYYEDCDKAHRQHGFTGPHGYCPALVAEAKRIELENDFLKDGCAIFGLQDIPHMPKEREKMLKLLLGACLLEIKR